VALIQSLKCGPGLVALTVARSGYQEESQPCGPHSVRLCGPPGGPLSYKVAWPCWFLLKDCL